MGSEASEHMMTRLKELALLKEQDKLYETNPAEGEQEAYQLRQQRHEEIAEEIKSLAEPKENSEPESSV